LDLEQEKRNFTRCVQRFENVWLHPLIIRSDGQSANFGFSVGQPRMAR
jgi:hypothetical protein